jgi:hypothetical protein
MSRRRTSRRHSRRSHKRSCSRGNRAGSVIVKGHKRRGSKRVSCYRRRKPRRS